MVIGFCNMFTLAYLVFGLQVISSSRGSKSTLSPANTNNAVAVLGNLADTIQAQRSLARSIIPDIAATNENYLGELFKRNVLSGGQDFGGNISECALSVKDFIFDVVGKKSYSAKMLDSWGKLGSGIAKGNTKWLGRYYECLDTKAENFSGRYFVVAVGADPTTALDVGICLPNTCSEKDATELISPLEKLIKTKVSVYLPKQPSKYSYADYIALAITGIFGFLLIAGTCFEIYSKSAYAKYYSLLTEDNAEGDVVSNFEPSVASQLLQSFSVIKSTNAIFDVTQKTENISVLHGLRFISMTWVIMGHTFAFGASYVDNALDGAKYYVSTWHFQAIGNGTYSVDTFFFLSGLLATYLGMREMKRRNGKLSIALPYLYRYLRLTPAYAFCLLISVSIFSKMGDGPIWPTVDQAFKSPCEKYWWTNLLYINNLYPTTMGEECFAWGWYLANDMQFFLLTPFILWTFFKSPLIGSVILSLGTGLCIMTTGILSSHYHQQPQALTIGILFYKLLHRKTPGNETALMTEFSETNFTTASPPQPGPSTVDGFWSDIYAKPWCRMGVYFIGMGAGYILYTTRLKIRMKKIFAISGWAVSFAAAFAVVYGLYRRVNTGTELNNGVAAFYNAFTRPVWGVCLAWVVVACSSGYGGPINSFLSWRAFIPLSRLSYCAYLVHPLVLFWTFGILEDVLHFSIPEITLRFLAITASSYAVAYLVSVLIEMPFLGIIKSTFGKRMGRGRVSKNVEPLTNHIKEDQSGA